MTNPTENTNIPDPKVETAALEATESPQTGEESPQVVEDRDTPKAAREAAKYRHRAKEAEAQVEKLTGIVQALQNAEIVRHLPKGISPQLWAKIGPPAAEVSADDGSIDTDLLTKAIRAVEIEYKIGNRSTLPGWAHGTQPQDRPNLNRGMFDDGIKKKTGQRVR